MKSILFLSGQRLTEDELVVIQEACQMGFDLIEAKQKILQFVESRMQYIAPNLSIMVGSDTAAKLMGTAGGLTQLCKMPACNILVLGSQKKTLSGFSSTAILPHTGFIYNSPLVQMQPPDIRRKVAKILAGQLKNLVSKEDEVPSGIFFCGVANAKFRS